jgi:hypothetical protein
MGFFGGGDLFDPDIVLGIAKGNFEVKKVKAPSKNPKKSIIICFAPDNKK